jgi:hypothetical protein
MKIGTVETCSNASSIHRNFIFEKHSNLDFWWYFKVSFMGRIWQFWVEIATLTVAESLPEARLKSSKPHNS